MEALGVPVTSEHASWNRFCWSIFLKTKLLISAKLFSTMTIISACANNYVETSELVGLLVVSPQL